MSEEMRLIIVSGLSGSGKSVALHVLEDLGYYCVDNLPLSLLRSLQNRHGLSYLFISHNLATVEYLAEQVLVMYLGRIVEQGPVPEVFGSPRHPYTRALLDSIPSTDPSRRDRLKILAGDVPSPLAVPDGCAFMPRCAYASERCRRDPPLLAEVDGGVSVSCFHPLAKGILQ